MSNSCMCLIPHPPFFFSLFRQILSILFPVPCSEDSIVLPPLPFVNSPYISGSPLERCLLIFRSTVPLLPAFRWHFFFLFSRGSKGFMLVLSTVWPFFPKFYSLSAFFQVLTLYCLHPYLPSPSLILFGKSTT